MAVNRPRTMAATLLAGEAEMLEVVLEAMETMRMAAGTAVVVGAVAAGEAVEAVVVVAAVAAVAARLVTDHHAVMVEVMVCIVLLLYLYFIARAPQA